MVPALTRKSFRQKVSRFGFCETSPVKIPRVVWLLRGLLNVVFGGGWWSLRIIYKSWHLLIFLGDITVPLVVFVVEKYDNSASTIPNYPGVDPLVVVFAMQQAGNDAGAKFAQLSHIPFQTWTSFPPQWKSITTASHLQSMRAAFKRNSHSLKL